MNAATLIPLIIKLLPIIQKLWQFIIDHVDIQECDADALSTGYDKREIVREETEKYIVGLDSSWDKESVTDQIIYLLIEGALYYLRNVK